MNRQALADATSLHDGAVPIYLMQDIANGTKASDRDAEKTADFLLGRLGKTNLIVKLKALQLIAFCIREGSPVFSDVIREEQAEISAYLQYSGPPDPVMGDERYRRIRVASQEVLVCLNDGNLPRQNNAASPSGNTWGPSSSAAPPQQQYGGSYSDSNYGQQGGYGGPQAPPAANSQPWGKPSPASRPAPYSDGPSGGYGNQQGYGGANQNQGYGGPVGYGGSGSNDHNSGYGGTGGNSGGYGNTQPQSHQPSGLGSWSSSASSSTPSYGAPKAAAGGMWSSSGYQKAAPAAPSYGGGSSRDTRPTVLVGHNLNFPKPQSFGNSGLIGGVSGTSSGVYGGPSTSTYGGSSSGGYGGASNTGGYGGNTGSSSFSSGGGYGNSGGGYGGNMSSGFSGASNRPTSFAENNLNRMLSGSTAMGSNGGGQSDPLAGTKLGKAVEGLKKIGVEAKDRWDRRNMDKSIGESLADHDELSAGPTVMDRGYFQPQMQQGSGGRDTSGEYERGMIDNLCASVGLARAPPADALKRFVDLAQTLDAQTIGDILLDKLEDAVWQVRLKALHVVLALLESPGSAPYMEFFDDNAGVFEELAGDAKPTVASKSTQVLRALGMVDESTPTPAPRKPARAAAGAARAASATQPPSNEVDFLGFDSLSIHPSHQQQQQQQQQQQPQHHQAAAPPNIYGSPSPASYAQPPPPQPEISLLDGFDPVPQPSHGYYQQQFQQPAHHQVLSPRQQPPVQHQQQEYGDLLPMSPPQQPRQAPMNQPSPASLGGDERSKTLSTFGKDLFTIANSPRGQAPAEGERSAFNFM